MKVRETNFAISPGGRPAYLRPIPETVLKATMPPNRRKYRLARFDSSRSRCSSSRARCSSNLICRSRASPELVARISLRSLASNSFFGGVFSRGVGAASASEDPPTARPAAISPSCAERRLSSTEGRSDKGVPLDPVGSEVTVKLRSLRSLREAREIKSCYSVVPNHSFQVCCHGCLRQSALLLSRRSLLRNRLAS